MFGDFLVLLIPVKIHQKYMERCIQLAKNGLGTTYPNPLVGCVIVHENSIIGEGWHDWPGKPHAEVNAIRSVKDKTLLRQATLYVNLEPCSHFGKTPPCADLIIEMKIPQVVIGSKDPNLLVAGRGIQKLRDAGVKVDVGILGAACDFLNKRFFAFHQKNRPYIFLKWAQTRRGFVAPLGKEDRNPVWISNSYSRQWTHKMRAEEQAILVGTETVLKDNPSLTTRDWEGNSPVRIVLDQQLRIPPTSKVFDQNAKTIVLTQIKSAEREGLIYETVDFGKNLPGTICAILLKYHLQSLIVEGGSKTLQSFIDANLWDEAFVFEGTTTFDAGIKAPKLKGTLESKTEIATDVLLHYSNPEL